jgi:hypothetical protein
MTLASSPMSGKEVLRVGSLSRSIALLALAAGCSSSSPSGFGSEPPDAASRDSAIVQHAQDGAAPMPSKEGGTEAHEAGAPPAPGSYDIEKTFVGPYAGLIRFRRDLSVGSVGTMNVVVSIYTTVTIADDATHQTVTLSASACHADTPGTGTGVLDAATLQIPDVVMTTTHLDPVTFSASGTGASQVWSTTELQGPIGWKWSSPSDAIPTSATDPRVFDQDGDGMPGVTMNVLWQGTTTPFDFVQAEHDSFSGTIASNGDLVGTTADSTEQSVINNPLGMPITSADDANTSENTVRFVHVPSALTCAQLMAQASSLFPAN